MTRDSRTLAVYDNQAEGYATLNRSDRPYRQLERFIDSLPEGGDVLDLGCGPGNWAARMVERGLRVDAVDASAGMAEVALRRHGIKVRQAAFEEIDGEAVYDGIWAHYSLLHAPRAALPGLLAALARALRPGGLLLLAMKLGTGEARDGKDRLYTYYEQAELEELLAGAGFLVTDSETGEGTGFDGSTHRFILLRARRP
ncbi:class I SAM-dependent methyltransferase [Tropicimonas sp. IMCC6043]|uniref:class I SAM-dependent DNA methyltransferase n=1 Tax=Tropicimonas sp. IMCC6043 TaxID=2510645 RepID=UPI00101C13A5|nr:methyltransferase domain-containing protein [Tropicimonas sp. IMCC6043]RYH11778.1 class I SAM-dependent methyltransferase [Tropicimonas sp. IMCC6043]